MDDLRLIIGSTAISGWTKVRVTRGIERFPSTFELELTERYSTDPQDVVCKPGDPCQVILGDGVVVTGYVDRLIPSISAQSHTIHVAGRGKCEDLVDCSAEWPGCQILGSSVLQIAQKLCEPYGITASAVGEVGGPIPQFNLMLGETPYDVIERICRYRALLVIEQTDGNLLLSAVGTTKAASGFEQGVNIEKATASFSMDQRYSEYFSYTQSVDVFADAGNGGNLLANVPDVGVPRHRRLVFIAEAGGIGSDIAKRRAVWEEARRFGRSMQLDLQTDSWRDSAGELYQPNTLVPLTIPTLKIVDQMWLINQVSYVRDENGTHCELILMPPQAFEVQPILLQPGFGDVPVLSQPMNTSP